MTWVVAMTWEVAGWYGGATLYHPEGCEKCDKYVTHVVEANSLNHYQYTIRKDTLKPVRNGLCADGI